MDTSPPIPAASLIVVRDSSAGAPELLMVERAQGMAFAGGALVFPGGRIDDSDRKLGRGEHRAARVAAIRETLEETAIPAGVTPLPSRQAALAIQQALLAERDLAAVLAGHGLALDLDALTPFARWVPKFHAARRFDTMFFLAPAPEASWEPVCVEAECSGAFWISASEALERDKAGQARLIFPTRRNLERLALHASFAAIRADAQAHAIEPISPWVEEVEGVSYVTIPDGIGYPVVRERLDGLWRG